MNKGSLLLAENMLSPDLAAQINSATIAYGIISENFGISEDGIERIVERLESSIPGICVTNGHILTVLFHELSSISLLTTFSHDALIAVHEKEQGPSLYQKIEHIAETYYTGSLWDLLESLAFNLRMVEIGHKDYLKKPSSHSRKEFLQQVVNAVRPASKLTSAGYPEAIQMLFRRIAELGVSAEQAVELTLEADRSSRSPFTVERELLS